MIVKTILSLLVLNSASFLLYCSAEIDESMKAVAKMIHDQCVDDSGVDPAVMDRIFSTKTMEPDEKFKCYLMCGLQQISAMDDDGNVDSEVFIGTMPEEFKSYAMEVVKKCSDVGGTSPCDKAYNMNVCAQKVDPNKYVFI
ncbi:general odorant-binding protein 83a-like [Diaphorina citri]|uniref:General odorant-binding protein 3 n=1 Tax=Diaphorina citri TaxID=121845 RepID=A0A1S3CYV9_DIACI|nr:general odorant-binding protein 83a-like [Diaphorina citri]KAI5699720.1 hypothetical protein M8J75_007508 [Diaphorina citri]KAI5726745.1 hypothetical protein M8J76_007818 [Diaphorina citri]KAI5732324.1 hypothetical protein M8J77_025059 [Diaphorina citri]QGX89947.1 general odorant-binding protein 3 [Diaphorina citri]